MPDIVSNTTPIISLLKIGQLELLEKIYGRILIPGEVFNEIQRGCDKPYYADISQLNWITIKDIADKKTLNYFVDLDAGEAEVIVLATEIEADLVIIDGTFGRRFAKHAGLKVTGTIGVLVKAKEMGFINKILPLLIDLQRKGIWISDKLIKNILKIVEE
jgi:uncharacterized protein